MPGEHRLAELGELGAAMVDRRARRSRAARGRARWSGPGSAGSGGRTVVGWFVGGHIERADGYCKPGRPAQCLAAGAPTYDMRRAWPRSPRPTPILTLGERPRRSDLPAPSQGEVLFDPRRAAATRPTRRSTRSSRSACSCPTSHDDVRAAFAICRELRRAGAAARRRQLAVRADRRRGAGHRPQQAPVGDRRVRPRRDDGRPSSRASCSTRSTRGCKPHGAVVPGRRQHLGAGDARRHGRQQLLRLALDRLRQHGAQRARDRRDARRRHRGALRRRGGDGGARRRASRELRRAARRDRRARARRDRAQRARRCCAASAATTSTSSIRRASGRTRADGSVNYAHLLVGSEGTLAWSRALTLKLAPLPAHRTLGVVNFPTLTRAMESAQHIVDARAVRGRARRPHDDRPRARQSGVPPGHRRGAGRRARRDPAASSSSATTRDDRLRAPRRPRRADGRPRPAGQRRAT